jgi:hypothetical protein
MQQREHMHPLPGRSEVEPMLPCGEATRVSSHFAPGGIMHRQKSLARIPCTHQNVRATGKGIGLVAQHWRLGLATSRMPVEPSKTSTLSGR